MCIALSCICNEARATGVYFDGGFGNGYWTLGGDKSNATFWFSASPAYAFSSEWAVALGFDLSFIAMGDSWDMALFSSESIVGIVRPSDDQIEIAVGAGYGMGIVGESRLTLAFGPRVGLRFGYILEDEVIGFGLAAAVAYLRSERLTYVPVMLAGQLLVTTW